MPRVCPDRISASPPAGCSPLTVSFSPLEMMYCMQYNIYSEFVLISVPVERGFIMPISNARKKANRKWDEQNRDRYWPCSLRFPAGDKQAIIERASALGLPVSEYIRSLVYADLGRKP